MKFSVSTASSSSAGKPGRALRGELDDADATAFWQAHDGDAEHLTLVFRALAQKPVELSVEREVSIKLYAMTVCDALAMAARFVDHARALEERRHALPVLAADAVWTEHEEVPACSSDERRAALARLTGAVAALHKSL